MRPSQRRFGRRALLRDGGGGPDGQFPVSGDPRYLRLRRHAQEQTVAGIRGENGSGVREGSAVGHTSSKDGRDSHRGRSDSRESWLV
jgi:hypothetical protein